MAVQRMPGLARSSSSLTGPAPLTCVVDMAWEISWLSGTREQLETLARQHFANVPIKQDFGRIASQKVEEEIRLHPLPSSDLPQVQREQVFSIGPIQVTYHIDSQTGNAEVRMVTGPLTNGSGQ
jgi:hypothetical protein